MSQGKANLTDKENQCLQESEDAKYPEDTEIKAIRELEEDLGENILASISLTELL